MSELEIEVFRLGAHQGTMEVGAVARQLGLPVEAVRDATDRLIARHLLRPRPGAPEGWLVPVAPETAAAVALTPVERSLRAQLAQVEEIRAEFTSLGSLYAEIQQERRHHSPIEGVHGEKAIVELIDDAMIHAEEEILVCDTSRAGSAGLLERANARESYAIRRGVQMRTLYQHAARHEGATQEYIRHLDSTGAQVRTLPEVFGKLVLVDQRVAFIPHGDDMEGEVVIRDPSTVRYLRVVFEHSWAQATPLNPGHFGTPVISAEAKQAIVRLLTEGMKDEVIARRLGISLRTCQKHIAEIMDAFRADSRFQLGYLIRARLGDARKLSKTTIDTVVFDAVSAPGKDT
ncbi:LuxR C-terminal-related transcriptional regulator [Streptomyces sp. NBC_01803]|uniref:LuxR C-terminal-related transcriptional regulator n=1 Tax=Streptomyces sp. NBC_01803 TaxID=2975946 RepID=UPI002DDB2CCA|nr:LuxR C-terminal-related transcriptional regulator [Streptomyces sp. NBC_01803]WSA42826.1 LuxR C-terminal-related transcriptional regulator [Streptomyces sp. NBC_01803]